MKKIIFLLGFVSLSLGAWGKKDTPFRDLSHKLLKDGISIDEDSLDLVFDYKLYKKLVTDSLLDDLILQSGFEPNDENRMIFFSVISKDLQEQIKNSFMGSLNNENHNYVSHRDMQYRDMQYQAEMTRSMMTLVQSMASNIKRPENSGKYGLAFVGILIVVAAEFGFFGKAIKISHWFFNVKDKIHNASESASASAKGFWDKVWSKTVEKTFLKDIIYLDYTKGDSVAMNFLENYKRFERAIKDDPEIVKKLAECKRISLSDRKGRVLVCPECNGPDELIWDVRDCSKK